jgi:hypothetical protein
VSPEAPGEEARGGEFEPGWSEKVLRLSAALEDHGLPYAFGGAIALNYHREPRSTLDIDINIFIDTEKASAALVALGDAYELPDLQRITQELERDGQARSLWGGTFVDLFLANTEFHQAMAGRVRREPFGETTIPVLSIEDLLICKALFDRGKDWVDIEAVGGTRRGELDTAYITSWLAAFLQPGDPRHARIVEALAPGS